MSSTGSRVETRSIDYVPASERHGKVWHQGPFWFTSNFVLITMSLGFIGPAAGLGLGWTFLAVVLGGAFGTFFMAFHANQGPTLGLPQMIQSRAQFGNRGAIVPFAAALVVYVGLNVFNMVLAAEGFSEVLHWGNRWLWYVLATLVAVVIAFVGYDLVHAVQRWLTYVLIAVFGVLTVVSVVRLGPAPSVQPAAGFDAVAFLTQFAATAGFLIAYAIYVSDYTRYMPADTSTAKLVAWTYVGAMGSTAWLGGLGAFLATRLPHGEAAASLVQAGDYVFPGLGAIALVLASVALVTVSAVNLYGGMLVGASAVDGFRPLRPRQRTRVVGILAIAGTALVVASVLPPGYVHNLETYLILLLYFLVPWTAVNLVDFYFVRRGHYAILEIFEPNGIYGRWSWRGLVAYVAGFVSMVPFFSLSFFSGPVAKALGGADISFVIGLAVSGGLYLLFCRNLDIAAERVKAARDAEVLDRVPAPR